MTTAKDLADTLIDRAKNLNKFVVERYMDFPPFIRGSIPFDIQHTQGGPYRIFVYALTQEEANKSVDRWLDTLEDPEC
jgi:hypothetical protein